MDWKIAEQKIKKNIKVGTDLNTKRSTRRYVESANAVFDSVRYGYDGEEGFIVRIGTNDGSVVKIPWSMLESCFGALKTKPGYNGDYFRKKFPKQAEDHGCHIHVVGMIFVQAGVASYDDSYFLL